MSEVLDIFIGYDGREHDAAEVCWKSLVRRSSLPVHVQFLKEPALRHVGFYDRPWHVVDGQRVDVRDGKPFSTLFSFTRFLVPSLMQHSGVALFVDLDFLFTADISGLFALADPKKAVQLVKHEHVPNEITKMDGQAQTKYWRKNWSSLILWNCGHPANARLTPREVNHQTGQWLHSFAWLDDEDIGEVPATWNHLAGVNPEPADGVLPCGIHFTLGIPSMPGHHNAPYADLWRAERDSRRAERTPLPTERLRAIPA